MDAIKRQKLLVIYTLLIFLMGVFSTGVYFTAKGYDVPWIGTKTAQAVTASETITSPVGSDSIEKIVEQAGPAVVKIETETQVQTRNPFTSDPFFRQFFDDQGPQTQTRQGLGSGFIISKDGYILTNDHVVEGASKVNVYLTSRQEPYPGTIVGQDSDLDLAVIKINAGSNLPILKFGDINKTKVGNWVIAIGNPYGLDHTVTVGVISAKGRPITASDREYKDLIQTDASINPGNSGGPLLNMNGEVVGINTAVNAEAQGIGFAIPSSTVQQVLDQLLEKGKVSRPWLGVYMQPMTQDLANYFGMSKPDGVLVSSVQQGSPAEKAGLTRGDIILEFSGKHISSVDELSAAVKASKIGQNAALLVQRGGKTIYVTVTIAEK